MRFYKVFPHIIYKYKEPPSIEITINRISTEYIKKNIDKHDIDYSDNFWKTVEKLKKLKNIKE